MATSQSEGDPQTFIAGEAITIHRIVDISAANTVTMTDAAADIAIGVSAETVAINGSVPVITAQGARVKVESGATLTAGVQVSSGTNGVLAAASTTGSEFNVGTLVTGGASGDILEMILNVQEVDA